MRTVGKQFKQRMQHMKNHIQNKHISTSPIYILSCSLFCPKHIGKRFILIYIYIYIFIHIYIYMCSPINISLTWVRIWNYWRRHAAWHRRPLKKPEKSEKKCKPPQKLRKHKDYKVSTSQKPKKTWKTIVFIRFQCSTE